MPQDQTDATTDVNPELALLGFDHIDNAEAFPASPGIPPRGPRMSPLQGPEQDKAEQDATWREPAHTGSLNTESPDARVNLFTHPAADLPDRLAFPAFVQPVPVAPAPRASPLAPTFAHINLETGADRAVYHAVRFPLPAGADCYATGEQAGPLRRNGRVVAAWTSDNPGYTDQDEGLYQAHPWVLALAPDGSARGVLALTTHIVEIDLRGELVFRSTGPAFDVIVIEGDSPQAVLRALADLVGTIDMPPRWALGFQQSRWSYTPQREVLDIARTFREHELPLDAIWIDIDYMDGFRVFTADDAAFPDPGALAEQLRALGVHPIWMLDPGIKCDNDYAVYRDGLAHDHFVKDASGEAFRGQVWPGICSFPDFTAARTRDWWSRLVEDFDQTCPYDALWVDMNEPAVFSPAGTTTMPGDARHNADADLGGPGTHDRYHNLFGMQMARATREGVLRAHPQRRPFVLTRANFLGGHRYAATWTGDNSSRWRDLAWSITMSLNLGLSAQPFVGCDIGGFVEDADADLYARWIGLGALLPFARAHSAKGTQRHEPWSFGERTLRVARAALQRRSALMPLLYTLFHEAATTGLPVMRPLFFAGPADASLREAQSSFLLGNDLLVRAVVDEHADACPDPVPSGDQAWIPFSPTDIAPDLARDLPELRLRRGGLVPVAPVRLHDAQEAPDELTLFIAPDAEGHAAGTLYEDAGDGHAWRKGEHRLTTITLADDELHLECAGWPWPAERTLRVVLLRQDAEAQAIDLATLGAAPSHRVRLA